MSAAVQDLGEWVAHARYDDAPPLVRERLMLTLEDTVGVALAGALTPELRDLRTAADDPAGPARLLSAGRGVPVEHAVWHNGTAATCLELDEGNKFARGHPAAHAFPAGLAVAEALDVTGADACTALLVGHETAARMGRATMLRPDVHPHGNWGAAGAAAAAARLMGLGPAPTAAAIDAAAALSLAGPFEAALRGSFVRNTWAGAAGVHGIQAARLAGAGLAGTDGMPAAALGLLGEFDETPLAEGLGKRWDVMHGYFKRHSSCSFTHPPADAALELREREPEVATAGEVVIDTHALAARLDRGEPGSRLAAMFSIPFVTATALVHGDCTPVRFGDEGRAAQEVRALARRVRVRHDPAMDERLPAERPARVTATLSGGREVSAEVANPVGDVDHLPLGPDAVATKLDTLLAPHGIDAGALRGLLADLPTANSAAAVLGRLP